MVSCVVNFHPEHRRRARPRLRPTSPRNPPLASSLSSTRPFVSPTSLFRPSSTIFTFPFSDPPVPLPPYPLSFQSLAHSSALFCTLKKHKPLVFNRFHTLRQKTQLRGYTHPRFEDQNETTNC